MVKLVVAENVNDWLTGKMLLDPLEPLGTDMDIAGQHNDIGVGFGNGQRAKLQMEV